MSKQLALLPLIAIIQAYTWTTVPFYALTQRPWLRVRRSKYYGVQATTDREGRTIYSRPCPAKFEHPHLKCNSFAEVIPLLDRNRKAVGVRAVLKEVPALDEDGKQIKILGKELKQMQLADQYHWLTVGEILDRADALARGLQKRLGIKKQDKVIIYADNSVEWFCAAIALQRLNAITVTLLSIQSKTDCLP